MIPTVHGFRTPQYPPNPEWEVHRTAHTPRVQIAARECAGGRGPGDAPRDARGAQNHESVCTSSHILKLATVLLTSYLLYMCVAYTFLGPGTWVGPQMLMSCRYCLLASSMVRVDWLTTTRKASAHASTVSS